MLFMQFARPSWSQITTIAAPNASLRPGLSIHLLLDPTQRAPACSGSPGKRRKRRAMVNSSTPRVGRLGWENQLSNGPIGLFALVLKNIYKI